MSELLRFRRLAALSLFLTAGMAGAEEPLRCEAEEGTLSGTRISSELPGFSGSGYVTSFDRPEDFLEVHPVLEEEGFYRLSIRYAAREPKINPVLVNGSLQRNCYFPASSGFERLVVGRVAMRKGKNTVRIGSEWGHVNVDAIELEPADPPVPFNISPRPVNPECSPEAAKLYANLRDGFLKTSLAGQQDERGERLPGIAEKTGGKAPAVLGLDLLNYSPAYGRPDGQIERARCWALEKGGIVTISWHWFSPFGASGEIWRSYRTDGTAFDAGKILDENSVEYASVVRDIDRMAEHLKPLRDAGVPVLWRPLHEAEGKWFWWGAAGAPACRALYRLMYDRFTRMHGLNNLIWVWTTTDHPDAPEWYPGDGYVDILAADIYTGGSGGTHLAVFDNLRQIFKGRKMIALAETDVLPDPGRLAAEGAGWLWFLVWDDFIARPEFNPPERVREVYLHDKAATLESLAASRTQAAQPDAPMPVK